LFPVVSMFPQYHFTVLVLCLCEAVPSTASQHQVVGSNGLIEEIANDSLQDVTGVDNAELVLLQQSISMRNRSWPVHDSPKTTLLESGGRASKQKKAVLVLLFMAIDSLPHLQLWRDWLASASKGSWHAFLHCVDYAACEQGTLALWPELTLIPTVPSKMATDLVSPMHQLLKHALYASPNPDSDISEKFIFLSETTLPMRPFTNVHMELGKEDVTDICIIRFGRWPKTWILDRRRKNLTLKLPYHSQWVILRRTDAEAFVQDWIQGQNFKTGWAVPLKGGHFKGEHRTVSSKTFVGNRITGGLDEYAIFATLYGAYQSDGQQSTYYPAMGLSISDNSSSRQFRQGRCRTSVEWFAEDLPDCPDMKYTNSSFWTGSGHSPIVIDSADRCLLQHVRDGSDLFMRKFATGSVRRDDFKEVILK